MRDWGVLPSQSCNSCFLGSSVRSSNPTNLLILRVCVLRCCVTFTTHVKCMWVCVSGELQQTSIDVSKNIAVSRTLRFDVKPCGQLLNKKPYRAYFDEPRFAKSMEIIPRCLEVPEDASLLIFGGRFDPEFSSFRLAAYPCSQTDCLPSDQLTELYFSVTSLKKFIKFIKCHLRKRRWIFF